MCVQVTTLLHGCRVKKAMELIRFYTQAQALHLKAQHPSSYDSNSERGHKKREQCKGDGSVNYICHCVLVNWKGGYGAHENSIIKGLENDDALVYRQYFSILE